MTEQQIRDHERLKVRTYILAVADELRKFNNEHDARFLDEIAEVLVHPDWPAKTSKFKGN
jgi:hypothetical protein